MSLRRKSLGIMAGVCLMLAGGYYAKENLWDDKFEPQKILDNSILKERKFAPEVKEVKSLDGKLNAYLIEEHSVPLVYICLGFKKMGYAFEEKEGVGNIFEAIALDGAKSWERKELKSIMNENGIKIGVGFGRDELVVKFSYVKEFEKLGWEILKAVLFDAHLSEKDIELTKQQYEVVRKRNAERVEKKLEDLYLKEFYKGHPLGRDSVAEKDKMDLIEASDIREFLKKGMAKDVLFVGGSGDIDEEKMREFLDYMFEGIEEKSLISDLEDFKPNYEGELRDVDEKSSKQSFVLMVKDGIERKDKDFYPFYVADFVFGGSGLNSRLNKVMREENGLTYGIYSYLSQSDMVNTWNVAWSASPNNTKKIEELFEKEYEKFIRDGITLEELEVAKESLLSSFNLRFNSLASIAEQLYYIGQEGLGADFLKNRQQYIRDIKLADVNRVIKEKWGKNNDKRWFRLNGSEAKE